MMSPRGNTDGLLPEDTVHDATRNIDRALFLFCPLLRSQFIKLVYFSHTNSDFDVPYIKIDQKKISNPSIPRIVGVGNFYFGQKLVTRSSCRGHKVFVDFEHVF